MWPLVVLLLLTLCPVSLADQVLANPSFEDEDDFGWQPFLSGYYLDRDCHDAMHGKSCVVLTPAHFYGIWQGVRSGADTISATAKQFALVAYANTEWLYDAKVGDSRSQKVCGRLIWPLRSGISLCGPAVL